MSRSTIESLEAKSAVLVKQARAITRRAEAAKRVLTSEERREVERLIGQVNDLSVQIQAVKVGGNMLAGSPTIIEPHAAAGAGSLHDAIKAAGFDRKMNSEVLVPAASAAIGLKTGSFTPSDGSDFETEYNPANRRDGVPLGADERFAYTALVSETVDAGVTSVPSFRQSGRTLGDPASGVRDIDATTSKHEIATTAELVTVPMQQIAHISSDNPNILFELPRFRSYVDNDLRLAYSETLDDFVVDALETAVVAEGAPADNLLEEIVQAVLTVQAAGYSPDTLIASPEDLVALSLLRQPDSEDYVAGAMDNVLSNLRKVASKRISTPMVVDRSAVGVLYVSPVRFAAFEQNDGATNTTRVRVEGNVALAIERAAAGALCGGLTSA